jgi:glycopeptide antibiotics resistance protein
LAGQAAMFYVALQLIIFRGKGWTRAEKIIGLVGYFVVLLAGLLFRNCFRDPSSYFQDWFVQRNFEWNPLSFVWDFFADRTSIVIAVINLVLFVPLPILLYANHIKPRFWAALILFFAIELLQPALGQGFFSLGDILLYSVGFLIGMALLKWGITRGKSTSA